MFTEIMLYISEGDEYEYKDMLTRDKGRWEKSDVNKDNKITKEEYTAFLHPEEYDHMKDVVVNETLQDIDKDGDGVVSLEEYLGRFSKFENGSLSLFITLGQRQFFWAMVTES